MGSRSPPIKLIYEQLVKERGEKCSGLPGFPCDRLPPEFSLIVDHVDNDDKNWSWLNLQLLCYRCNRAKNPPKRHRSKFHPSLGISRDVDVSDQIARERVLNGEIDHETKSPELKIAEEREPEYVRWLMDNIERQPNGLTFAQAEYEGAYFCEISPVTARRYFKKLYFGGIIDLGKGVRGNQKVIFPESKEKSEERLKTEMDRIFERYGKNFGKTDPEK